LLQTNPKQVIDATFLLRPAQTVSATAAHGGVSVCSLSNTGDKVLAGYGAAVTA
jgi:hypothetical protein